MLLVKQEKNDKKEMLIGFCRRISSQVYLFVMLCSVFGIVLFLTYQDFNYYWYGVQISLFFFVVSLIVQFVIYQQKIQEVTELREARENFSFEKEYLLKQYKKEYQELLNEYYTYKQQEADKRTEQMDYFSLWIHQIKTPISAMSLLLQRSEEKTEEQKKMEQELLYLNDYTHLALNYLKLEEAGKELEIECFSLDEIISSVIKKYSILFIYKGIQLEYEQLNEKVWSDKKWIQVLIEQIISNSLKYTSKGVIKIYLEEQKLIIEDTGSGISKEDLPKIFEKGYTGLNGRLQQKSTGIGLFISKKISARLDHPLSIESEVGKGTKAAIDFSKTDISLFD